MSCRSDGLNSEKPSDFWFDFLLHSKICETKKLHKCILAALVEAPEKQTFSLYVDELLCDKTDVIKSVKISLTQLFS